MAVLVRLAAMLGGEVLVRRVGMHLGGVLVLVLVREPEMLKPAVRLIVGDMVVTVGVHHDIVALVTSRREHPAAGRIRRFGPVLC